MDQYQQEQTYNEPVKSDEIYANIMQEERVKNMVAQTSPDNQLAEIEWRIKGYRKDSFTGQWIKSSNDMVEPHPMLVSRYIAYLSSILNDNTRFTNLDPIEINAMMKLVIEWVVDDLDAHAEEYGLMNDFTERSRIGFMLLHQTFFIMKRSQGGAEARRIWSQMNMQETNTPQMQKSFMDKFKFWK